MVIGGAHASHQLGRDLHRHCRRIRWAVAAWRRPQRHDASPSVRMDGGVRGRWGLLSAPTLCSQTRRSQDPNLFSNWCSY